MKETASQAYTRTLLYTLPATPDGKLHMKHPQLRRFGFFLLLDCLNDHFKLYFKDSDETLIFEDIDAVILSGWLAD